MRYVFEPSAPIPWLLLLPPALGAVALYLLLPKPQRRPVLIASILGLISVVIGAWLLTRAGAAVVPEQVLFYIFAGLAVGGAGVMLTQRNPARAAISFALVVVSVCGLFLLQGAPFLMAATITVYAGAIVVTFLFVLMLSQQKGFSDADDRTREPFLATLAGFILLGTIILTLARAFPDPRPLEELTARAETAAAGETPAEVLGALGDRRAFIAALYEQEARFGQSSVAFGLGAAIENLEAELNPDRPDLPALKTQLAELAEVGRRIHAGQGAQRLPAANVAGIGTLLYSHHLLAVELGGTLLLVATIGAIAITQRPVRRDA